MLSGKIGENGHLCPVPDLRGNAFSLSPLNMRRALSLSYLACIILRNISFIAILLILSWPNDAEFCQKLYLSAFIEVIL